MFEHDGTRDRYRDWEVLRVDWDAVDV